MDDIYPFAQFPPYSGSGPFLIKKKKRSLSTPGQGCTPTDGVVNAGGGRHPAATNCSSRRATSSTRVSSSGVCFVSKTNSQMSSGNNQDSTIRSSRKQSRLLVGLSVWTQEDEQEGKDVVRRAGYSGLCGTGLGHGQAC